MKKFLLKFLVGFIAIPTVLVVGFLSLDNNGFFDVDRIDLVIENTPDQPAYLQPLVKKLDNSLEIYRGQSLWQIRIEDISLQVSQEKWIQDVTLTRRFPSQIRISIVPKEVKFLMVGSMGKFFPVVADGSFLNAVEPGQAPDVPLLIGDNFFRKLELRKKSVEILEELPLQGSFSRNTISEIRYDVKEGYWMTLIKDGIKVKMGEEQMSLKSARVSQVIDYMDAHSFQPRVIDANLSKKVLVRLRKDP